MNMYHYPEYTMNLPPEIGKKLAKEVSDYLLRKERSMNTYVSGIEIGGQRFTLDGDFRIKRVIFNDPATIVLWEDGTKTVVKCMDGDTYSEEIGLAMCICKKALGDKFHRTFTKWVFKDKEFKYKVGDRVKFTTSISGVKEGVIVEIDPCEIPMPYLVRTDDWSTYYLSEHMHESGVGNAYVILGKVEKEGK